MTFTLKQRAALLVLALGMMLSFIIVPVMAQTTQEQPGNGFRISPVRTEYVIDKGKTETLTMTVENPANVPTKADLIANDFVASDKEDGEPRLILNENEKAPKNSFKDLVGDLGQIELGPNEKKDVPIRIRIPENANAGGYYGAVRVVPISGGLTDGNVGLTASVGTIVLIRVPGPLVEKVNLVEFSATQNGKAKSFFTGGDVASMVRLKNEGDIHVKPFGKLQVKNMFGKVVHEYELNLDERTGERDNVLPGSIRRFENEFPDKKWLGRYTIVANLGYGEGGGELISAQTTFWYLPVWALIVLLILVLALAAAGYLAYKRYSIPRPKHGSKKK